MLGSALVRAAGPSPFSPLGATRSAARGALRIRLRAHRQGQRPPYRAPQGIPSPGSLSAVAPSRPAAALRIRLRDDHRHRLSTGRIRIARVGYRAREADARVSSRSDRGVSSYVVTHCAQICYATPRRRLRVPSGFVLNRWIGERIFRKHMDYPTRTCGKDASRGGLGAAVRRARNVAYTTRFPRRRPPRTLARRLPSRRRGPRSSWSRARGRSRRGR